jgi:uncharacterized protein YdaU (DUF1376 family)
MADTRHLTLEEHGAYHLLLLIAWRSPNCALPDDDRRIAQMLGITPKKWTALKPVVLSFWTKSENGWEQKRLTKERRWVDEKKAKQSDRAQSRWGDNSTSTPTDHARARSQRLAEARKKGRHTSEQWHALLDATGRRCVKCHATGCELVKDHIKPIYQSGSDAISNIQPLCVRCNSSKGADGTDFRLSVCNDLFERLPECLPERVNGYSKTPAPLPPPPVGSNEPISSSTEDVSAQPTDKPLTKQEVIDAWQGRMVSAGFPAIAKMTGDRERKLRARLKDSTLEEWQRAMDAMERSAFCRGENDRGWKADFDFLLQPKSFTKLLEGAYDH